jgi:transcriptional regulator with XRE-family HTH domain
MKTLAWKDLKHKASPQQREIIKREAIADFDRMGFASLRKARRQTQKELAQTLGIDQASISALENRSDLLLSTLAKYVRALGGDVEIRAVFPEATFNLEPLVVANAPKLSSNGTSKRRSIAPKPLPSRHKSNLIPTP